MKQIGNKLPCRLRSGQWAETWPILIAALLLIRFAIRVVQISLSFPNLFDANLLIQSARPLWLHLPAALIAAAFMQLKQKQRLDTKKLRAMFGAFLRDKAGGLLLALIFFVIYLTLAAVFNRVDFNNNNVFFAADAHQWRLRLATADGYLMEMRAIHPLAFLILRPLVFGISLLSATDLFHTVLFLVALTGSLSVFLAWTFIRRAAGSAPYAFLFASIFGISTAELMFNSVTETYVFSGFLLVLFFVLLQNQGRFVWLVLNGVGIFGVTISNLAQSLIGLAAADWKIKRALLFTGLVIGCGAGLNLIQRAVYPDSALFFNPADYGVESQHYFEPSEAYGWTQRIQLVSSDMFLFSVVAPQPYLQVYHREDRSLFPKFNFMQGERLSRFAGAGKIAIWVWLGIFGAAIVSFARVLRQEKLAPPHRLALALLGCLAFNFAFHLFYGFEPFLYAADWTYALIFFAALALRPFANNNWLKMALVILLALLTLNNLSFLYYLMYGFAPYIPATL